MNTHNLTTQGWRYAAPARLLHWLMAVLIPAMLALGWYMMEVEDDPGSEVYFQLHKSLGLLLLLLLAARAAWRLGHRPASLPASVAPWQSSLSRLGHGLLYAGMLLVPAAGLAGALLSKSGVAFFGLALPRWFAPDHALAELWFELHELAAWTLAGLIVLHAIAGLKHLVLDKDDVFQRML
ncbi:cytochrome b [Janthinobacterium sp. PC23-8]|uniref:cytochrome b n=1 Tax=Janthinobacterium sp. PC23-8 TaxID=2012679 RepID=UPI000B96F764|nr:cytochrome b [Janthinobacterium sp. PC23-8]OYO28022.1 cytochrome B [Janthinobacterium sp. PC23-8]